jgi:hypothetical protein
MLAKELIIVESSAREILIVLGTKCKEGFFSLKFSAPAPMSMAYADAVPS